METKIYEPIIMFMRPAWWRHQNKEIFVYLNVDCLCLFDKILLTLIYGFLRNQPCYLWAYNNAHVISVLTFSEEVYFSLLECWLFIAVVDIKFKVLTEVMTNKTISYENNFMKKEPEAELFSKGLVSFVNLTNNYSSMFGDASK